MMNMEEIQQESNQVFLMYLTNKHTITKQSTNLNFVSIDNFIKFARLKKQTEKHVKNPTHFFISRFTYSCFGSVQT